MPRKQFWALRENVSWERTHTKTSFPTEAIQRRWPKLTEDTVTFAGLAPADVDRPAHERWAYTYEVVGLGSAVRSAAKTFQRLQEEAREEVKRRGHLKIKVDDIVKSRIDSIQRAFESMRSDFIADLVKYSMKTMFTRTWSQNIGRYMSLEEKQARWKKVAKLVEDGVHTCLYDALVVVLAEARDVNAYPSIFGLLQTSHYSIQEHHANLVEIQARNEWINEAEATIREAAMIREAHRLEEAIQQYQRTSPD